MNGGLTALWDNPRQAALYSFGSGFIILSVFVLVRPGLRASVRSIGTSFRGGTLRWWEIIGGFLGAMFVLTQSWTVPLIGVAAFSVGIVAGQTANSLLVDRLGVSPRGVLPITGNRLGAAVVAIGAVAVAVADRLGVPGGAFGLPVAASFLAGAAIAFQQAINGRVAVESGNPWAATWLNFGLGSALLAAIFLATVLMGVGPSLHLGGNPLLYLGGVIGLIFIALAAWSVTKIGVLLTALLSVAGQLTAALVLDLLLPTAGAVVTGGLVAAVALAYAAVVTGSWRRAST